MAELRLDGVTKRHGGTLALDDVDLHVADGEFLCLLGPSGAGKTTLLRCIAGLDQPDQGDVVIDGRSVLDASPAQRDVAMVFESYALYPHLTVADNLAFPLRERRVAPGEIRSRIGAVAERLGVAHTLDRQPATLSGGEMQRVAIGRAIVREARVYLFDQPLSNLDAQLRQHMRAELKRLHRELGSTLVYATPDQLEAMTMSQTIAVMRGGRVLQCDSPESTYFRPRHSFAAAYVGDPPMNFVAGTVADGRAQTPWFEIPFPGRSPSGLDCVVGVRPEDLRLGEPPAHANGDTITFEGHVYAVEMCGDHHVATVAVGGGRIKCIIPGQTGADIPSGAASVSFSSDRAYFIDPATEQVL